MFFVMHFVPDSHFFLVITTVHPAECIQCWDTVPVLAASGEEVPLWPITNTSTFCSFEKVTIYLAGSELDLTKHSTGTY
jgi:hypothetical protein